MSSDAWPTKRLSVASLHLDPKNPRLGRGAKTRAPRELVQYLFEHDKALTVAQSIAERGFFPNEALLAYRSAGNYIVLEGNRRLAALKALREPGLLEGAMKKRVERLSRLIITPATLAQVPVTIAPSRRATDGQLVARHLGSPVLAWEAENRASFILEKLSEGYTNETLCDELFFTPSDIQKARQTRAIADMARSLDLADDVTSKLDNPRAKIFSTLGRVFDSAVGRKFLQVEPSSDHGLRGTTSKKEFVRVFSRLVGDVALGKQDSRTLNSADDIKAYFESWPVAERPQNKRGTFVPAQVITNEPVASTPVKNKPSARSRAARDHNTVLPKTLKIRFGDARLRDIYRELSRFKRADYPNAGAVLLRVFFELAALNYLKRCGELSRLQADLRAKNKLAYGTPTMKQLTPILLKIAKKQLTAREANAVEKAITSNPAAPFSISELHSFVHNPSDLPTERDILQFWNRVEPLFRLMLEQETKVQE